MTKPDSTARKIPERLTDCFHYGPNKIELAVFFAWWLSIVLLVAVIFYEVVR